MIWTFWAWPLLAQATGDVVPGSVWEKYPLIALLAVVLFWQGHKMDKLTEAIKDLAVAHAQSAPLNRREG